MFVADSVYLDLPKSAINVLAYLVLDQGFGQNDILPTLQDSDIKLRMKKEQLKTREAVRVFDDTAKTHCCFLLKKYLKNKQCFSGP